MPDDQSDNTRHRSKHGFTLTELLVAIAIFVLVLGLLGFPLFAAFGYIQKAIAQSEAQAAGRKAMKQLAQELGNVDYIFDIPPTGEWVSVIPSNGGNQAFGDYGTASAITFVRFGRILEFPWIWDDAGGTTAWNWTLLQPNYSEMAALRYELNHRPFYNPSANDQRANPYILTRYQHPTSNLTLGSATVFALDGSYPMDRYDASLRSARRNQGVLQRLFSNDLIAITPHGPDWDVSSFVLRPMRVTMEALSSATCTTVYSHYPLWAARSRDIDEQTVNQLATFYYPVVDTAMADPLSGLRQLVNNENHGLYPLYPNTPTDYDTPALDPVDNVSNPFGYQVRVFDRNGVMVFGCSNAISTAICSRHFMDWPPIDRADLATLDGTVYTFDLVQLRRWKADVSRQRTAGKLVFEQPYTPNNQQIILDAGNYYLPIPDGSWQSALTYRVKLPQRITIGVNSYTLVDKDPVDLEANEFCLRYKITGLDAGRRHGIDTDPGVPGWCLQSREVVFGTPPADPAQDIEASYTICDLQPSDTVVATYSTLGMLDVGLTMSRKDRSGARLEDSRQNFAVNLRVEARNAMRRARRGQ